MAPQIKYDFIIKVPCDGDRHRIGVRLISGPRDAQFDMLDHNLKTLKAFDAFEADPPACYEVLRLLQEGVSNYRDNRDEWHGLTWREAFGRAPIDLEKGITSADARIEAADWQEAVPYLEMLEHEAADAREDAAQAIDEMLRGYFADALDRAAAAKETEEMATSGMSTTWERLAGIMAELSQFEEIDLDEDEV